MDETVTSRFNTGYYLFGICGSAVLVWYAGKMLYWCLQSNLLHPVGLYLFDAAAWGVVWVAYYFFSKSWKRINITPTEVTVYDVVYRKLITIPYADITAIHTYRTPGNSGRGGGTFGRDFVIEYTGDKWVSLSENWYANFDELTMAIYLYKYGPGHGRDRYVARHQR